MPRMIFIHGVIRHGGTLAAVIVYRRGNPRTATTSATNGRRRLRPALTRGYHPRSPQGATHGRPRL